MLVVDAPWFTFWLRIEEVLALKLVSPAYAAVMLWLPVTRTDVEKVA